LIQTKKLKESTKHTDNLLKALKTAETDEEKASIAKLMQEDINKYVKGVQEKPIKEEVDTSVTLPFYGKIESPKTAKEVAGRAIETVALGAGGTAKVGATAGKSLFKRALTGPGSKIGATYGAGSALSENKSLGETALQAGIGGVLGGATDLALIGGGKGLQKLGEKLQKPVTKTAQKTKEEVAGKIITGKTKDKSLGVKALESIDTKGVKTFEDLEDKLTNKIIELSKNIDKKLDKDTSVQKLKDMVTKAKSISGKEVKTNYVKTALEHLQEVYRKTGDNVGVQNIKDTIKKATTTGLTKKEINNIARSYGVEFGKKAFSKTGEPLTSVNSKLYETVRKGLKEKARETAAGLGTKEMDKTMSAIYRTRDLVRKNKEEVNKLQQKIQERGLGEKLGRGAFNALNMATMGGLKGFIERGMGRGTGLKTLNYLEIEKNLAKNLKLLEKANKSNTKSQLEKTLNEITKNVGVGISKTGEVISKIPGIAEEAPRKSVQSLMDAARTKMPIGMTIKDVSKEGFSKAGVSEKLIQEANKKSKSLTGYHVVRNPEAIKAIEEKGFSLNKFGSESGTKDSGDPKGIYFFPNKEVIKSLEGWSDIATPKNTLKRTLNLEKPYIVESKDKYFNEIVKPATKTTAKDFDQFRSTTKVGDSDKISEYMLKNKYDGILDEQGLLSFDEPQIIVLDLNKIKKEEFPYKEVGSLTTKLLKKLEGKTTVNKQFISDLTNSPDLKQTEKDLIRAALKGEDSKINVTKFANKVKAELLPLKIKNTNVNAKYENITLPEEIRGSVKNYDEHIFESPIKTSAGSTHFSGASDKYFGHTRIEDMADNKTRRVIEVQSDLYQKGNLEKEMPYPYKAEAKASSPEIARQKVMGDKSSDAKTLQKRVSEVEKLQQYNDPTAHFRMVREEISQAAKDKKTKVQFPTGETAMKIEGLGETSQWAIKRFPDDYKAGGNFDIEKLTPEKLKVGERVWQGEMGQGRDWIITDVLGNGKFKAVPKNVFDKYGGYNEKLLNESSVRANSEQFDISGKVDTSNPIYKFYEKEMGKYLKSKYNAKEVIDDQGVSWYEVDIKPEMKGPIEAFGIGAIPLATQINQDKK